MGKVRLLKNQLRREKAKKRKLNEDPQPAVDLEAEQKPQTSPDTSNKTSPTTASTNPPATSTSSPGDEQVDEHTQPLYHEFESIFSKFEPTPEEPNQLIKPEKEPEEESEFELELELESEATTNEKFQVSIAELKARSKYPQIVEWCDVNAKDPYLLVAIKLNINVVPVPAHWSNKHDYLAGRRGFERPPFQLPGYILETGIQDMRNHLDELSIRQQQRDRVQPKMGKLDIDYQKLHDAFFKHQTRPRLLGYGDVYFEGREISTEDDDVLDDVKPGKLSTELLKAMGLPENGKTPPPWLSTMREIGKPPAYSHLLIPGIDITYANIGYLVDQEQTYGKDEEEEHWGEVQEESSDEEEIDEEEEEEEEKEIEDPTDVTAPTYFEEEGDDKHDIEDEVVIQATEPKDRKLYTVLQDSESVADTLLGSERKYDLGDKSKEELVSKDETKEPEPTKFKF